MDRRKTIFLTVLINGALLIVLFLVAFLTEEEAPPPVVHVQEAPLGPLFTEPLAMTDTAPSLTPVELPPLIQLPPLAPLPTPEKVTVVAPPDSSFVEVMVKKGESLDKIAKTHHVTIDELIQYNRLPSTFLRVGQVLKVPLAKEGSSKKVQEVTPSPPAAQYYTVKVGDNPWTIAMKHHMKVEELLKLNHLNEEKARKLKAGDRLRIQ